MSERMTAEEVHLAMLRGSMECISWRQHCHLTGEVPNGEETQLSEIVKLRERIAELEAALKEISIWSEKDNEDLEICRLQWRGCVAIANEVLEQNN